MDKLMEELKDYGADVNGAMNRFMDDVDLYKTCYTAFLKDEAFLKLGEALSATDYEKAFECAHTLKGVSGNMGLTPLSRVICTIVEKLRNKEYSGLQRCYTEVIAQLDKLGQLQR
ncbi:MAG: Hpt domain-containing protein [Oscillospiraceae bacterium]